MSSRIPYLLGVRTVPERLPAEPAFPFNLPFIPGLAVTFRSPVVFFVGENGTGKSTLLESVAALCRLPVSGGSRNEGTGSHGPEQDSTLSRVLRPAFRERPRDGFFLRAEFAAHFASLLDERRRDPDFWGNPYELYGGRSLHAQSHGEAFLAILQNRIEEGIFLLDEPESALSPQRLLALLALIHTLVGTGRAQFLIATHSPILLTFPQSQIISFDHTPLRDVKLRDTSHYQVTRGILNEPERYWRHLVDDPDSE